MIHSTIHRLLLALLMAVTAATASAYDFYKDGIYYNKLSDGKSVEVTKGYYTDSYSGSVTIPSQVTYSCTTYSVTSIGNKAFYDCIGLTSVTIPNSVTEIGGEAFAGCLSLTSVTITDIASWCKIKFTDSESNPLYYAEHLYLNDTEITDLEIPNSVTSIGSSAFYRCSSLNSVTIPNSVTEIGAYAFTDCTCLTSVTIPESVTSIGSSAFYGTNFYYSQPDGVVYLGRVLYEYKGEMPANTSILIDEGTVSISPHAFDGCTGLTSVTIPNSVTSIGDDAFYDCTGLTSVTIPNSVTSIGSNAFYLCSGLTSVTIPNSVTEIGESAFLGTPFYNSQPDGVVYLGRVLYKYKGEMPANTSILIEEGTVSISPAAFSWCSGLTSVTIPNSVTKIGEKAFFGCDALTYITIPNSVTYIGYEAFSGCIDLEEIIVDNGNTVYDSRDNCNAVIKTATNTLIVGCKTTTIPNSVTSIGKKAFYGCSLTSVTIPNSVTEIGSSAFFHCSGLTSVTIGNSVTEIGDYAFFDCDALTSISIPNSVTKIGERAFSGSAGLTSVTIPNSVTEIGSSAFDSCIGLIKSAYPEHLSNPFTYGVSIAYPTGGVIESDGTIYDVDKTTLYFAPLKLSSVTIPSTVTSIGDDAFTSCTDLTSVVYNAKNCSTVKSDWLSGTNVSFFTIGTDVETIPDVLLGGLTGLTSIVYNAKNSTVSSGWLSDCANVKTFEIGSGVVSIPSNLCKGLSSIVSITIPSSVKSIGKNAFTDSSINKVMWLPTTPPTGCESVNATINFVVNDNYTFGNQVKYQYLNSKFTSEGIVYVPVNPSERTCDIIDCTYSSEITTLDIPEKVVYKSIEMTVADMKSCAFMGNTHLQSVTMSYQGDIPDYAFQNCTALESITFSNPSRIGNYAFSGCTGFTEMTIPESVITIGDYAFSGCTGFTEMTIPESVTTIGDYAFSGCTGFTSMTIPKGVTSIGEAVFSGCPDLSTIVFNAANCVVSPNWLSGADNIIFFKLGNDIESIPSYLCSGLTGLTTITIPELVSSIGENAFIGSNIAKVIWLPTTAPSGIENVDAKVNYVLNDTYSLGNQYVYEHLNSMFTVDGTVYVPVDMTENTCDIIDCSYSPEDKSIVITDKVVNEATEMSVLDIKPYSYYNNPYIEEVTISYPGNIGGHAFEGCTALTTATLGDGITAIGSNTFYGCSLLSAINLPGTVTSLSDRVFYGCAALASLTIPNNVTSIGDYALGGCTSLSNITIKHGMDAISLGSNGSSALFADCPLDVVYIGRKLEYTTTADAGYSPFYGNTSLRTVEITDAETQIYDNEFNGCSNLQSVQIGNGVTTIGEQAFTDCWSMQLFTVGKNLESIGKMAFSGCSGLTSLYCHATVPPTCGEQAFNDINKFDCSLYVPEESESLYQAADQWKDFFFIISGINDVNGDSIDDAEPVEYYNLQGIRVENPTSGVYIRRQGSSTTKVTIK